MMRGKPFEGGNKARTKGYKMTDGHKKNIVLSRLGKKWDSTGKKYIRLQEEIAGRKKPIECEVCGRSGRINFDHNHQNGKFRGWLCLKCNVTLGMVDDDSSILMRLIKYLNSNM